MNIQLIVLIAGAVVMSLEIVASRLLAPYFGSTLYVWGSLIGIVLAALAAGYWLGGRLADRRTSKRIFANILLAAGLFVLLIPLLSSRLLPIFQDIGLTYGPLISATVLLGGPGILLGMVPPYALKLRAKKLKEIGATAGNLYSLSTVGSIIGTFATTFVLIPLTGVTNIIFGLGVMLVLVSLTAYKRRYLVPMLVLLIFLVPGYMIMINNVFAFLLDDIQYDTIYETDSAYYHIIVAEDRATGNERMLFLDNLRHSAMYIDDTNETPFRYPYYFHAAYAFNPDIDEVLFIGGGGMSAPKHFLQEYKDIEMDVVEIDPEVVRVAEDYFAVPDDPRMDIHVGDGRLFLENTNETYDLIVLDAYSDTYVPFHLMTIEFFRLVKEHLNEDGVVAFNLITPLKGELARLFRSEYRTMDTVFEDIYLLPLTTPYLSGNVVILATDTEQKQTSVYMEPLYNESIDARDAPLLTDDYAPVNVINPLLGRSFAEG